MKLDLLTNATVVDDAIRFVSQKCKFKGELNSSATNDSVYDKEKSNEPDYDQLEEEQEEEAGEITTNHVF